MEDIVTGIIGMVVMLVFLSFVLVKVSDIAFWIVCAGAVAAMLYAFWGDAMRPMFQRDTGYDRSESGV
jgi:CDP-diglyceride synthetase